MVRNATSLTGSGLRDWLIQRISAVVIALYTIVMSVRIAAKSQWQYENWFSFFQLGWVKVFSFLVLVSLLTHAWIGMWTVFTDYVACAALRLCLQIFMILTLLVLLVKGILIIWGL